MDVRQIRQRRPRLPHHLAADIHAVDLAEDLGQNAFTLLVPAYADQPAWTLRNPKQPKQKRD